MKTVFFILFLTTESILLMGCDAQVVDYVRDDSRPSPSPIPSPSTSPVGGPIFLKISPGRGTAISSDGQVMMNATITPTRRTFSGGGMSAEMTLSRSRASVQ